MRGLILWSTPFVLLVLAGGVVLLFGERETRSVWRRSLRAVAFVGGALLAACALFGALWSVKHAPPSVRDPLIPPVLLIGATGVTFGLGRTALRSATAGTTLARLRGSGPSGAWWQLSVVQILLPIAGRAHVDTAVWAITFIAAVSTLALTFWLHLIVRTRLMTRGVVVAGVLHRWRDVIAFRWDPPSDVPPLADEWDKLLMEVRYQPFWPLPYQESARLSLDVSRIDRPAVARLLAERLQDIAQPSTAMPFGA